MRANATLGRRPRHRHSPLARRLAREHRIDLDRLVGTGPGGRVTRADVLASGGRVVTAGARTCVVEVALPVGDHLAALVDAVLQAGRVSGQLSTVDAIGVGPGVEIQAPAELNRRGLLRRLADPGPTTGTASVVVTTSGVLFDTPRLGEGQVAAFDLGAVVERPVVVRGPDDQPAIAIRSMAYLALTYDGLDGPLLLSAVKDSIEHVAR